MRRHLMLIAAALLACPTTAAQKPEPPSLSISSRRAIGFEPLKNAFTAKLERGEDSEDFYCPRVEWEFGLRGQPVARKLVQDGSCPVWGEEGAVMEREFHVKQTLIGAGDWLITVRLVKQGHEIAHASTIAQVLPGVFQFNRNFIDNSQQISD